MPEDLRWIALPSHPGVGSAVQAGGVAEPRLFTVRAKFPPNYRLGPHTHTDDRGLTIMQGSWMQGVEDQFEPADDPKTKDQ